MTCLFLRSRRWSHIARPAVASGCVLLIALATGGIGTAQAATCAPTAVSARGEVASFRWLALIKARGNWRSKVRTIPSLGPDYANFNLAEDQVERCISDQRSIVCSVSARPCRP